MATETVTYYLTRDTNCLGELSQVIDVWYRKPMRCPITIDAGGIVWIPTRSPTEQLQPGEKPRDLGYYGNFTPDQVRAWFHVVPDTDIECIKAEQNRVTEVEKGKTK